LKEFHKRERHAAERQDHFRQDRLIDRETGDGERRSVWRMRVTNGFTSGRSR
jgi:hypothetical protein